MHHSILQFVQANKWKQTNFRLQMSLCLRHIIYLTVMRKEGGIKYLLDKLETISRENAQLKNSIRERQNFNHKLCSENRKRRLRNNQLVQLENQRLLELTSLKGHEEELRRAAQGLRRALEESDQKLESYEDEILILKTEVTKQKQEVCRLQDENALVKRKNDKKDGEIERLNILHAEIMKKKTNTGTDRPPDYESEVIDLICQNQQLEMSFKDAERETKEYKARAQAAEEQIKALEEEVENNKQIIAILREEYEQELKDMANSIKGAKTPSAPPKEPPSIITSKPVSASNLATKQPPRDTLRPRQKVSLQQYGSRLAIRQQSYFSSFQHLLFSPSSIENLSFHTITLHHCQPINLYGVHTWFTRIRIVGQGEVQFGVANSPYGGEEVMSNRNYLYYSNCSGLVVVDKEGKFIDQYATLNDTLTLTLNCLQGNSTIKLFKNDKIIYEMKVGEQLAKKQTLYPFLRLFDFMAVELE